MNKKRNYFGIVAAVILLITTGNIFVSCSESDPEKCECDTTLLQENIPFSEITLSVMQMEEGSQNNLVYYNGSYYFTKRSQDDTIYYFICNPEMITDFNAEDQYNITGNVRETSNVIIKQMYVNHTQYRELEVLTFAKAEAAPEPEE